MKPANYSLRLAAVTGLLIFCTVALALNGQEAVDLFTHTKFDLVLMDCQMPVLDGYEATRRIRAMENRDGMRHTPIVALTANVMEGDREKCTEAGMDYYLPKPFKQEQIAEALGRFLVRTA